METTKQVTLLLEKVQKGWSRMLSSNKISRIDKDILIEDIKRLYELVHELEIGTGIEPNLAETSPAPHSQKSEPVEIEPEKVETSAEIQKCETGTEKPEIDDHTEKTEKAQDPNKVEFEIVAETEPVITPGSDKESEDNNHETENHELEESPLQPSTAEKFTASKTLADIYRANGDNSIAAKMQKNKLSDLKSAIGLNEKFLFINEIFGGNTADYHNAIEKLNHMNHYHEALQYLDEIKEENKVTNKEACSVFVEILQRRF